jgi:hypothetical protein
VDRYEGVPAAKRKSHLIGDRPGQVADLDHVNMATVLLDMDEINFGFLGEVMP